MKITSSECQDCGQPCLRKSCRYYEVTRYYCDKCMSEEVLYDWDGMELCLDCIKKELDIVDGSNGYEQ